MRRHRGTWDWAGVGGGASIRWLFRWHMWVHTPKQHNSTVFILLFLCAGNNDPHRSPIKANNCCVEAERCLSLCESLFSTDRVLVYSQREKEGAGVKKKRFYWPRLPMREQGRTSLDNYQMRWCAAKLIEGLIGINYMFQWHSSELNYLFSAPFLLRCPPLIVPKMHLKSHWLHHHLSSFFPKRTICGAQCLSCDSFRFPQQ